MDRSSEEYKRRRREINRRYYERNKAKCQAATARWITNHEVEWREYRKVWTNQRRSAMRGTHADTAEAREYRAVIAHDPCVYCSAPSDHVDHIVPIAAGGMEVWENLTPACASCNQRKGARSLLGWLANG